MYKLFFTALVITGLSACVFTTSRNEPVTDTDKEKAMEELLAADRAFSDSSEKLGMKKAFLNFIADDAVLLRPGYLPIVDGDVIKFLISQEDTSFVMTWTPKSGQVSESTDLGYTYGVYEIKLKTSDTLINGTYVSIWQKQKDGTWKFVLDTGNQDAGKKVE